MRIRIDWPSTICYAITCVLAFALPIVFLSLA